MSKPMTMTKSMTKPMTKALTLQTLTAATLLTALSGCSIGPDYTRPDVPVAASWGNLWPWRGETAAPAQVTLSDRWWEQFNDPALNRLVTEGLAANSDLLTAAARVTEARAQLDFVGANSYPTLGYQADGTRQSQSREAVFAGGFSPSSKPFNTFGLSLVLNYEIDLWGRIRRAKEQARAVVLGEQANAAAVRLAVASDIVTGYVNLRTLDAQVAITEQTIKARQETLDYTQKQFNHGVADVLTLRQAESELAAAQVQLPQLQQQMLQQQSALAVLMGRTPRDMVELGIVRGRDVTALPVPQALPEGAALPSTLLERRPDVQAAEQQLVATNAQIGIAKADYFPTLSLSGLLGLQSSELDRVLRASAKTWNIGGTLAGPIVDFGRTGANVDIARSQREQALVAYQQQVRVAFKDAMDALNGVQTSAARTAAQERQLRAVSEALRVANLRYGAGYSDYLTVLDAQRTQYQSQLNILAAKQAQVVAAVNLVKALGGGYQPGQGAPR